MEYATDRPQIRNVSLFCASSHFVQKMNGLWLQAWLGRVINRIDHFDFHFDSKLASLNPSFSFFSSFVHMSLLKIDGHELRSSAHCQPRPDTFYLRTIGKELSNNDGRIWLAARSFTNQFSRIEARYQLPRRNGSFFAPLISMPADDHSIFLYGLANVIK
ncbi:MAG TPA: hypothetical protein VHD56_13910 [Tepidisphaeraceae bacterium]|nr:hypothetical protein [Tepidisphaeraceae bacterium]